jgi:hypothetical protein
VNPQLGRLHRVKNAATAISLCPPGGRCIRCVFHLNRLRCISPLASDVFANCPLSWELPFKFNTASCYVEKGGLIPFG